MKVMWDGRMDYSALHHEHHVDLNGVLDLQLVDLRSRAMRNEGKEGRLKRLRGCVASRFLEDEKTKKKYAMLTKLSGLVPAIKEHKPAEYERYQKIKGVQKALSFLPHELQV